MPFKDSLMIFAYIMFVGLIGYFYGLDEGKKTALANAYSTSPVSEKLELACVGLWVGEQNRKYAETLK
jgi:hypothetical protein